MNKCDASDDDFIERYHASRYKERLRKFSMELLQVKEVVLQDNDDGIDQRRGSSDLFFVVYAVGFAAELCSFAQQYAGAILTCEM